MPPSVASKSKIDKAGATLSKLDKLETIEHLELDEVFHNYRKYHLRPLTECTLELQKWLTEYGSKYYIAQRLKRKPQILRKLRRLSVRLTQLQDIGGCRIIVDSNDNVNKLLDFIKDKAKQEKKFSIEKVTDYRDQGRDVTGYRALHVILNRDNCSIELQIRSRIQHFWAESIERTSVIYGHHLKEQEGDAIVINYFKLLSDNFFKLELGRQPTAAQKIELEQERESAEKIIKENDHQKLLGSHVNTGIIKTLLQIEKNSRQHFNNWILIFDWNTGSFVSWDIVERDDDLAAILYSEKEKQHPSSDGFEVVLIGSSDIATVSQTHSHYFGITYDDNLLKGLEQGAIGIAGKSEIDADARRILLTLRNKKYWGDKTVSFETLKNHFCKNMITFNESIQCLHELELILLPTKDGPISLNIQCKAKIDALLG